MQEYYSNCVPITKAIIWTLKPRRNFRVHQSTVLEGRLSSDIKKRLAQGKERRVGRRGEDARAGYGKLRHRSCHKSQQRRIEVNDDTKKITLVHKD